MAKQCLKCGSNIPTRVRIDGVEKNLQNRKFCLNCSPFGKHNTVDLTKPQSKYASSGPEWKKNRNRWTLAYQKKRYLARKKYLIKLKGGACNICSYSKCIAALDFHHKNPENKLFGLTASALRSKKFAEILAEAEKCILLCANCHRETHYM